MERKGWYTITLFGLLAVAGVVVWRTWPATSPGQFDPVSVVIGIVALALGVMGWRQGALAHRRDSSDVTAVAARLAVRVRRDETEARRQLLDRQDRAIDVRFDLVPAPAHDAERASRTGTLEEVVDYYRRLGRRRLVITGEPGSGKTVLAIQLALGLLHKRAQDEPIPVRMSAAVLDMRSPYESAVRDALRRHLQQVYRLSRVEADELVDAGMVVPVLDGLDEMDATDTPGPASRAARTIRACNAYLDGVHKASVIVTCRTGHYQALESSRVWVHDAARVQIRPVGLPAARAFLVRRAIDQHRWRPVLDVMRRGNRPLATALSTPWRLMLAATVYEGGPETGAPRRDPQDLISPVLDTEDKIRDHLLGLFIPAVTAMHSDRYPVEHVHRWLSVLAAHLNTNTPTAARAPRVVNGHTLSGTDLFLDELWPLAGNRLPRAIATGLLSLSLLAITTWTVHLLPIRAVWPDILGIVAFAPVAAVLVAHSWTIWPMTRRHDFRRLRTRAGRRQLATSLALGLASGIAVEVAGRLLFGLGPVPAGGLAFGLFCGIGFGLPFALTFDAADEHPTLYPRRVPVANLVFGMEFGLAAGLALGLAVGVTFGGGLALAAGFGTGLIGGCIAGLPGLRYIGLVLCTRRWNTNWLPWRLGVFLDWSYRAGLLRIAGAAYQFRHRELQDYLARNEMPRPRCRPSSPG